MATYCSMNGRMMCDLNKYLSVLVSLKFSFCYKMHWAVQRG